MPANWTGEVVGKMHLLHITNRDLAQKLGYSTGYVSAVLNGKKNPKKGQAVFENAVNSWAGKGGASGDDEHSKG